jgi:hypothetical protein
MPNRPPGVSVPPTASALTSPVYVTRYVRLPFYIYNHILHEVVVTAGKAASVFVRGAHFLNGKERLIDHVREICAFRLGKVVWIEFYPCPV